MDDIIIQREPNGVFQVKIGEGEIKIYNSVSLLIYRRCDLTEDPKDKDQLILGIDSPEIVDSLCEFGEIQEIIPIEYDNGKVLHLEVYI